VHTGKWTITYRSDFKWQNLGHCLSCIVGKRLIMMSAKVQGLGFRVRVHIYICIQASA
jgi:hypothetical protein